MSLKDSTDLTLTAATTSTVIDDIAQVWDRLIIYVNVQTGGTFVGYFEVSPTGEDGDWYLIKTIEVDTNTMKAYVNVDGFIPHFRITGMGGSSDAVVRVKVQWQKPIQSGRYKS